MIDGESLAEAYPYNPHMTDVDRASLEGLHRLRAIPDRDTAAHLASMYSTTLKNSAELGAQQKAEKLEERRQRYIGVALACSRGDYGQGAGDLVFNTLGSSEEEIRHADYNSTYNFLVSLRKLRIDVHAAPCRQNVRRKNERGER